MSRKRESRYARCGFLLELPPLSYYTISRTIATRNADGFDCNKKSPARMQDGEKRQSSKRSQICLPAAAPAIKACTAIGTGNIFFTSFAGNPYRSETEKPIKKRGAFRQRSTKHDSASFQQQMQNKTPKIRTRRTGDTDAGMAASCTYSSPPFKPFE